MRKGISGIKSRYYKRADHFGLVFRTIASVSILALLLGILLWVPVAVASDEGASAPGDTAVLEGGFQQSPTADDAQPADGATEEVAAGDGSQEDPGLPESGDDVPESAPTTAEVAPGDTAAAPEAAAADAAVTAGKTGGDASNGDSPQAAGDDQYGAGGDGECCYPPYVDLELYCGEGYWAGDTLEERMENYNLHHLSIDYELKNVGTGTAYDVHVTKHEATNGVTAFTTVPLPLHWDEIAANASAYFTIIWSIPQGVTNYVTSVEACAYGEPECNEEPLDPCIEDPDAPGCQVDPCEQDPDAEGCQVDPCEEDPDAEGCQVDPCEEDPDAEGCQQPLDPCIDDPTAAGCQYSNPEDLGSGDNAPTPESSNNVTTGSEAADNAPAPVLTRAALPNTGADLSLMAILATGLLFMGIAVPAVKAVRKRR